MSGNFGDFIQALEKRLKALEEGVLRQTHGSGPVFAKDSKSALAQFNTIFAGQLPRDAYLSGPLTQEGTTLPQWELIWYTNITPPPESLTFKKVS